ncbi:MAG: UDP-glucose/GDP-mannose dehydrogenase family protein [Magnetococcus sp. DMHC-6]
MREAAALTILPQLIEQGAILQVYDPEGMHEAKKYLHAYENIFYTEGVYQSCQGVDALVILTEWNQFRSLNWDKIKTGMRPRADGRFVVCDFRNIYDPIPMAQAGFHYVCIGR